MLHRISPAKTRRFQRPPLDAKPHRGVGGPSIGVRAMNRGHVSVQLVATYLQSLADLQPVITRRLPIVQPGQLQLIKKPSAFCFVAVQFDAAVTQAMLPKSPIDDVQSSGLLCNEQHRFADSQALRDDVCNRLALARSRRSDEDEILTF